MPSKASWKFRDYNGESSTASFEFDTLNSGNIDTVEPLIQALETALEGVTVGRINTETILLSVDEVSSAPASTPLAQREVKWLLTLQDTVTNDTFQREVPTADLTKLANNEDKLDLTSGDGAALKGAIDGNVVNPRTGNSAVLIECRFVGRNS